MGKINLLSSKIYNRIAAGEVVERPASVVKELVENSIDAGATNIRIDILDGGISAITVTDNGVGIDKSDLQKALLPHATSKISKVEDLDNIASLGFRGEALASIASVSKIKIKSKTNDSDFGYEIYAEGDIIGEVVESPTGKGTEISVNNLFFNTPVRAKFLKSVRSEEAEITALVTAFILGNSNVAFKYTANDKVILQSYGDGLESAMVKVYSPSIIDDCFYIDVEKNGLIINGYIGKHYFTKSNRSSQTVFLNGRKIINQTISSAIGNAYSSYLMKRQYPFYVLSITIPTEFVDVNVHPNKLDVRFANNQIVYGTLYSVISKVLDGSSEALNIVSSPLAPQSQNLENNQFNINEINSYYVTHKSSIFTNSLKFSDVEFSEKSEMIKNKTDEKPVVDIFAENKAYIEKLEREREKAISNNSEQVKISIENDLKVIGQALNTYLIVEDGADIYFIDQHAAHERILFDKLNQAISNDNIPTQPILVPFVLNVNNLEYDFLLSKLEVIKKMGFDIEEFGYNSFKISAIPAIMSDINIKYFFDSVLSDIDGLKDITVNNVLIEKLAKKACKSAIKSGDKLCESEINALLDMLKGDMGLKCPHGRPVCIKITRTEIDKWFKRIV